MISSFRLCVVDVWRRFTFADAFSGKVLLLSMIPRISSQRFNKRWPWWARMGPPSDESRMFPSSRPNTILMNALISACGNGQRSGFSKGKMWECGFLTIWTLRDGQHALLEPELDKPGARDFNVKPEENAVLSYSLSLSQFSILLVAGVPFLSKHASPSCIEPPSIMITQLFSESLFYLHIFCGMMSIISIVVWRRSKTALCTLQVFGVRNHFLSTHSICHLIKVGRKLLLCLERWTRLRCQRLRVLFERDFVPRKHLESVAGTNLTPLW